MRIALVSLNQRWLDKDENFRRCDSFAREAAGHGCDLVVFPEMTLSGYSLDVAAIAEHEQGSESVQRFARLAADAGVDIIFGACLVHTASGKPRNYLCLARRTGGAEAVYAKIHPFSFSGEDKVVEMGSAPCVLEAGGLHLGCSVCYDLRFPELFSPMAPGCDAMINIANWPAPRAAHWRALLVARAIENQWFALGVNRVGIDGNGLQYEKCSMAIAPDGTILVPVISGPEMDVYEIDREDVTRYRKGFPTIRDKRYALYRDMMEASDAE